MLNNSENQQHLSNAFDIEEVIYKFIDIIEPSLKLRALLALTLYGYNNLENQSTLKRTNAILYDSFRPFIETSNSVHATMACFQVRQSFSLDKSKSTSSDRLFT